MRISDWSSDVCSSDLQGRLESNFGEVVRDAAVAGLGIAQHSTWHVCEDLRAGRLQVVLPDHSIADSGIYAVMPQRRLVPPRVRAFTEFRSEEHTSELQSLMRISYAVYCLKKKT